MIDVIRAWHKRRLVRKKKTRKRRNRNHQETIFLQNTFITVPVQSTLSNTHYVRSTGKKSLCRKTQITVYDPSLYCPHVLYFNYYKIIETMQGTHKGRHTFHIFSFLNTWHGCFSNLYYTSHVYVGGLKVFFSYFVTLLSVIGLL